jgi:hypothetical protein
MERNQKDYYDVWLHIVLCTVSEEGHRYAFVVELLAAS